MRMKKKISMIAMLILLVSMTGCGSEKKEFTLNTYEDNLYKDTYMGIQYELPEGWTFLDDATILSTYMGDADKQAGLRDGSITGKDIEVSDETLYYAFAAQAQDGTSSAVVAYVKIGEVEGDIESVLNSIGFEQELKDGFKSALGVEPTLDSTDTIMIGGKSFYRKNYSITANSITLKFSICAIRENDMVCVIETFSVGGNSGGIDDLLNNALPIEE